MPISLLADAAIWHYVAAGILFGGLILCAHLLRISYKNRKAAQEEASRTCEKLELEEKLKKSGVYMQSVLAAAGDGILGLDASGGITFVNPAAEKAFGWTSAELVGKNSHKTFHGKKADGSDYPSEECPIYRAYRTGTVTSSSYEVFWKKDGTAFPVEFTSTPLCEDGNIIGAVVVFREITDRLKSERLLRESEEKYRLLFENNPLPMWVYDLETLAFLAVNDSAIDSYGYSRAEFLSMTIKDIRPPEDIPRLLENISKVSRGIDFAGTWHHKKKDGTVIFADIVSHVITFNGRKAEIVLANDVTAKVNAAESVRRYVKRLELLHEIDKGILELYSGDGVFNKALVRVRLLTGCSRASIAISEPDHRHIRIFKVSSDLDEGPMEGTRIKADGDRKLSALASGDRVTLTASDLSSSDSVELRSLHEKGIRSAIFIPLQVNGRNIGSFNLFDTSENAFDAEKLEIASEICNQLAVALNQQFLLTEERETAAKAQAQERLAAVGQLAAGIAHDFNNMLNVIIGYSQILQLSGELSDASRKNLDIVVSQSLRAADLVKQILDFSRQSISTKTSINLGPFIKEVVKLFQRTIPENITIRMDLRCEECWIDADPVQIQQMLLNLAVNARDAMPTGGTITFRVTPMKTIESEAPPFPRMPAGKWLCIEVADTGTGIAPENLPRIFEPFFTTKPKGKGTGLGLAQVYGLVKKHDGFIDVKTELGKGTTFIIYLPEQEKAACGCSNSEEVQKSVAGETILLVEDNPDVLEVGKKMIQSLGYRVIAVEGGKQALKSFETERIDLVLTDLTMPGMSGAELYRALREKFPSVKVLIASGYPQDEESRALVAEGSVAFIQKPYSLDTLSRALKEALSC